MTDEGIVLITLMSVTLAIVMVALIYFRCRYSAQTERIKYITAVARQRMDANCIQMERATVHMESSTTTMAMAIATTLRNTIQEEFEAVKREIGTGLDECYSLLEQGINNNNLPSSEH